MNTRVAIFLDYSYLLPKLNLNFVLDDSISGIHITQKDLRNLNYLLVKFLILIYKNT
jgi:hypothetical protein